jgi:hypothetical protein
MKGRVERARAKAGLGASRGLRGVARIVSLNVDRGRPDRGRHHPGPARGERDNAIVDWRVGAGDYLTKPFHGMFEPDGRKAMVAVNWGLAAVVYGLVGGFIARLLRR